MEDNKEIGSDFSYGGDISIGTLQETVQRGEQINAYIHTLAHM